MPLGLYTSTGVRRVGPVVQIIVVANAGGLPIYQQSTFAAQVGTKTLRIKRIKGTNLAGVDTYLHIGTGAAGAIVDALPPIWTFNGLTFDFPEWDVPEVEVNADFMAWTVAVPVTVQIEVEELG